MTVGKALDLLNLPTKRKLAKMLRVNSKYFDSKPKDFKLTKTHSLIVSQTREIEDLKKRVWLLSQPTNSYVLFDGSWFEDMKPRGAKLISEGTDRFVYLGDEKIELMDVPQSKISFVESVEDTGEQFS